MGEHRAAAITGGTVEHFSLPSFEGDGRCSPGYPPNREHVCFNSSTATALDTRQGVQVGTLEVTEDGVNLFVAGAGPRVCPPGERYHVPRDPTAFLLVGLFPRHGGSKVREVSIDAQQGFNATWDWAATSGKIAGKLQHCMERKV